MSQAVERPAWRISFRGLLLIVLGVTCVAFVAGRYIFVRYGGYRPLALAHVPQNMRYRARVALGDSARVSAIEPLLNVLDPRHVRLPRLAEKLGVSAQQAVHEVAFGVGPDPFDFVLVFGLQRQAGTGLPPAQALCEVLSTDGIHPQPTGARDASGPVCRLPDGAIVAGTQDGAVVVASRLELVKGLLGTPDLGDRLGFSGPSVRGVAPKVDELAREATTLAERLSVKYP